MHGFEDGAAVTNVCARHQAQAANQPSAEIRNNVTVEILAQQNVELFRPHHQLHRGVVDDHVLSFNLAMSISDLVKALQKQSVGELHDVCFVHTGDLLTGFAQSVIESEMSDVG